MCWPMLLTTAEQPDSCCQHWGKPGHTKEGHLHTPVTKQARGYVAANKARFLWNEEGTPTTSKRGSKVRLEKTEE